MSHLSFSPQKKETVEAKNYRLLCKHSEKRPRHAAGRFKFSFGDFNYVDTEATKAQYVDIFYKRAYDFSCDKPNPLIIDCGAHIGLAIIRFKQIFPESTIIAYEADPTIAKALKENVENSGVSGVSIVPAAVWVESGTVSFSASMSDGGHIDKDGGQVVIPAVRFADTLDRKVDLLKLDIEGAEHAVLLDLAKTGKLDLVDRLICEFHERPQDAEVFLETLAALRKGGFSFLFNFSCSDPGLACPVPTPFFYAPDGNYLTHLYAWKTDLNFPESPRTIPN